MTIISILWQRCIPARLVGFLVATLAVSGNLSATTSEVWVTSIPQADSGTGSEEQPFDGSSPAKLDALLSSLQDTPGLTIHLGAGTFASDVTAGARWAVQPGWIIEGAGMYLTTCKMVGNLAGQHWDHEFFKSAFESPADNVAIRDLTVDCNWPELSPTADIGAKGDQYGAIYAIDLRGSNILIENVRHLNSRGSVANGAEAFGIRLSAPSSGSVTGNTIRYCRAELPQGNYGSPFSLHGWMDAQNTYFLTNSSVYGNVAVGQNSQEMTGFTTGGVNGAFLQKIQVYGNTFIDCQSIFYQDTGTITGLTVQDNDLIRGWMGVGLVADNPAWTKDDIQVAGNNILLQNRVSDGATYGLLFSGAEASNISISKNNFSFDPAAGGYRQFYSVVINSMQTADILDNTADENSAGTNLAEPVRASVHGYATSISGNRTPSGATMTGLSDTYLLPLAKALNFSTRGTVGTGENVLIQGFIVGGNVPAKVLLRASGPSLGTVTHPVADPVLVCYDSTGTVVATNDDWRQSQESEIQATGIPPVNDAESAILVDLLPGAYTAVMSSKTTTLGIGLLEVYDLSLDQAAALQNVSTRGLVGAGSNVLIGGLIIGAGQNPTITARAIGPSLAAAGIENPLSDPILELHDSNGGLLETNDNWMESDSGATAVTGIVPTDAREAAIVRSLAPGSYTAIVRGNDGAAGIALVELYRLP